MDKATSRMEDEDTDNGTDTTVPDDDNDDIASFTTQLTTAIDTQKPVTSAPALP